MPTALVLDEVGPGVAATIRGSLLLRALCDRFDTLVLHSWTFADYMVRWRLAKALGWSLYLHWYVGSDPTRELHTHPRPFWSLGLRGGYVEERGWVFNRGRTGPDGRPLQWIVRRRAGYRAPWLRRFGPEHTHRLRIVPGRACWTLCLVGPRRTESWGWYEERDGEVRLVDWRDPALIARRRASRGPRETV